MAPEETQETQETLYILDKVAKEVGVDRDTIRRWELQGKIPFKVRRNNVGWRVYSAKEIEILKDLLVKLHPVEKEKPRRG